VVAVGEGVSGFAVGDRVACAGAKVANHAEVNLVPQNLCAHVPAGVDDESAAFVTVGAVALQGVRMAAPTLGECFAVVGLGLIGQLALQLLKANGCTVLGIDLNPRKVALAKDLGADEAVRRDEDVLQAARRMTAGRGVDGVIIAAATSSNDPVALAGDLCRDRGRVVVVGAVGMEVPRRPYYDKELSFLQSRSYGPGRYDPAYEERGVDYPIGYVRWTEQRNLEAFLAQCAAGRIRVAPLISHRFPIDRAEEAYALIEGTAGSADGGDPIGVLLTYPAREPPAREVIVSPAPESRPGALRIGVIGAGAFASGTLVPAISAAPGVRLVSIASARGFSARHLAERHRFERCTTDAAALVGSADIDAVFIATRHDLHAGQAEAALLGGNHVFVEKPLALNEAELQRVLAAQRDAGRILVVGYNRRFSPLAVELRGFFARRASPLILQYRVNAGQIAADSWIHDPAVGGGRIVGECCHFIDLCSFLVGAPPVSIFAQGVEPAGEARADDNVTLSLRFADGSLATVAYVATGDARAGKERLEVIGDGALTVLEDFRRLELRRGGNRRVVRKLVPDKGHRAEVAAFLGAVRTGIAPIPLDSLAATSRATFAALRSMRTGEAVRLDPPS
jgi:predicted dehydrogenase